MGRTEIPGRFPAALIAAVVLAVPPLEAQDQADEVYSLQRAVEVALMNSHDIAGAEERERVAGQQVREAWASVLPDISATASYQRNLLVQEAFLPARFFDPDAPENEVTPVRFGSDNTWRAGLSFSQPLFEYDVFIGVGAAGRFRSLEAERLRGTTQSVVTAVRTAYLNALLAAEEVRLTENSVERVRQTLEETRALNRVGLASDYDVLRLEVQLANVEPNLRRAENAREARKRALLIEMGSDPTVSLTLEGRLNDLDITAPEANDEANRMLLAAAGLPLGVALQFDELSEVALARRTELRQQRMTINLEETRLASQKAEYYPTLSIFSSYDITAQQNGSPDFFGAANQRTSSAVTGLSVEFPVFRGFSRDARVQQTRATVRQNEAQLARLEKEIESQLRTVLDNLEEARLRVASQRRAVQQAARGFDIASAEYRAGVGSQLQITDAEVALRESEFNYAQAIYDYLIARAQLDSVVGTVPQEPGELLMRDDTGE